MPVGGGGGLGRGCARGRARADGRRWLVHGFLADYGRYPEKIIRAHSALGWEGRGYWGKMRSKIEDWEKSGKLI